MGGTLRLGNYECTVKEKTLAYQDYKTNTIKERHRHRYEFNNKYKELLEEKGMIFSGINTPSNLVEIIELPDHPHLFLQFNERDVLDNPGRVSPI